MFHWTYKNHKVIRLPIFIINAPVQTVPTICTAKVCNLRMSSSLPSYNLARILRKGKLEWENYTFFQWQILKLCPFHSPISSKLHLGNGHSGFSSPAKQYQKSFTSISLPFSISARLIRQHKCFNCLHINSVANKKNNLSVEDAYCLTCALTLKTASY